VVMPIDGVNHSMVITSTGAELDTTPPAVEYLTPPAASNANGWFRRPVSVLLAASDAGSGVWRIHRGLDTTELEPFYGRNVSIAVDTAGEHVPRYCAHANQPNAS